MLIVDKDIPSVDLELVQKRLITDLPSYASWLQKTKKHYDILHKSHPELDYRPYQYEFAATYASRARNLCAAGCGLGKTIIVGLLCAAIYSNKWKPGQVQIAAPSWLSANTRWLIDLNKIQALEGKIEIISDESQCAKSDKPIWVYTLDFVKRRQKSRKESKQPYLERLIRKKYRPSLLVIDEVHLIQEGSLRYTLWRKICKKAKRVIALSGTLTDGRLEQVYNTCELIYSNRFAYGREEFKKAFKAKRAIKSHYLQGRDDLELVNPRYLSCLAPHQIPVYSELARKYVHRVSFSDPGIRAVVSVPTRKDQLKVIEPTKQHIEEYRALIENHKEELKQMTHREYGVQALTLLQILQQCSNRIRPEDRKLKKTLEIIEERQKVAIFCSRIDISRELTLSIRKELGDKKVIRLYATDPGEKPRTQSMDRREEEIAKFLYSEEVKVGVFSVNLASESIDLNAADTVIFYDLPWQALRIEQAVHRSVRPGSPYTEVEINYLVYKGFIDEHQYSLYAAKLESSYSLLDFNPRMRLENLAEIKTSDIAKKILEGTK